MATHLSSHLSSPLYPCCKRGSCGFVAPDTISKEVGERVCRVVSQVRGPMDELEIRLCDCDEVSFSYIRSMLDGFTGWDTGPLDDVITDVTHSDGIRTRRIHSTGHVSHVRKEERDRVDLRLTHGVNESVGLPTRVRVCLSREQSVDIPPSSVTNISYICRQNRRSYLAHGFRFDVGSVSEGTTYNDLETSAPSFRVEIELVDDKDRCPCLLSHSMLMKVLGFSQDTHTHFEI